ncbi:MAG: hypothetical protein VX185_04385 [Pseudomonadota bacterium]|nr:hypothetical protein [Pseudomonadota bacterium]
MGFSANFPKTGGSSYQPHEFMSDSQATQFSPAKEKEKGNQYQQQAAAPLPPTPTYESLFPEARIPRALFTLGEKFGGPQMLSKANEASAPSPVAKVYEDLFDIINSWDKLTVFVDDSGSMGGSGSIVYFPGLDMEPQNPDRMGEGQMLMGHLLDFIIAARDPARALPIEMVSIHNRLGEDNTDPQRLEVYGVTTPRDLKRFFDDHKPGAGTPMGKSIRAYCTAAEAEPNSKIIKRKFMALGDGEDNHDSSRKLASSVVSLWKNFNATVTLFPLTPSGGRGLKWMDKSDSASPKGKVDTTDDFLSEYIQILTTTVKNQYGRMSPKRDAALKEIKAVEKQIEAIEKDLKYSFGFSFGRPNPLLKVPALFDQLQKVEQKYELRTKDSRGLYSPFDYFAKALLSELPKYDSVDERDSNTHKVMNAMSRSFNSMMV